jgi:hypothetical protein
MRRAHLELNEGATSGSSMRRKFTLEADGCNDFQRQVSGSIPSPDSDSSKVPSLGRDLPACRHSGTLMAPRASRKAWIPNRFGNLAASGLWYVRCTSHVAGRSVYLRWLATA